MKPRPVHPANNTTTRLPCLTWMVSYVSNFILTKLHRPLPLLRTSPFFTRISPYFQLVAPSCSRSRPSGSYRTVLCVLFDARIIAAACYTLAQHVCEGTNSPSLDARISPLAPSASLPTPPSHKPTSPDATRFAIERFRFSEPELDDLAGRCAAPSVHRAFWELPQAPLLAGSR